jgi:hypothetical protein
MNTAFGAETFAVDTHIFRVGNRTGLARARPPGGRTSAGQEGAPPPFRRQDAHHWLILHGRYVCKARTPECWRCPVADLCQSPGGRIRALGFPRISSGGRSALRTLPGSISPQLGPECARSPVNPHDAGNRAALHALLA